MTSHWKAILGVGMIFVLGFGSGVVCSSIFVLHRASTFLQHPAAVESAALEKRLTQNLDLDPSQQQLIHGYFLENLQRRKELNQQIRPQARMLNQQTFQQIAATLRPDQEERFRQNIEKFRNRLSKVAASADWENLPPTGAQPPGSANSSGTIPPSPR